MMSTHCPKSWASFMDRCSTLAQMTGMLPSPTGQDEPRTGLNQQDAKSNWGALITSGIINQSKVYGSGLWDWSIKNLGWLLLAFCWSAKALSHRWRSVVRGVERGLELNGWQRVGRGVHMSFAHYCDLFVQEREGSGGFGRRRWGPELKHSGV